MVRQSFSRAKAFSMLQRFLWSRRLCLAGCSRPRRPGRQMRRPRPFSSSRSQSALATVLGPMADDGSIALVAQQVLRLGQAGQENQSTSGVAHLAGREEEGQGPAFAVADRVELGVPAAFRASDGPRPRPPFRRLAAVRCAFRCVLHDHDRVALSPRTGQVAEDAAEDTQPRPARKAVVQRPVRSIDWGRILPSQAVAQDVKDPAQNPSITHSGLASRLGKVRPQPLYLLLAQPELPAHATPQSRAA